MVRLATVELLIMGATVGVVAALGRTAPPALDGVLPVGLDARVEPILGFPLSGPPTIARLLLDWRPDYLLGTAAVLGALLYWVGVRRLRARGEAWPFSRSCAWMIGCLTVLLATSSGLGRFAQTQFSLHMISHIMLEAMAPMVLVLGAPVTLTLRVLPVAGQNNPPGLREAIVATVDGRVARILFQPLVVLPLFIGSFYALYSTGLFADLIGSHFGQLLMNGQFLVVGYLYYWVFIGIDPGPRRVRPMVGLGLLLAALPFLAVFDLGLMSSHTLLAPTFYRGLALPWVSDLIADQELGGVLAWGAATLPVVIGMLGLLARWAKSQQCADRRISRPERSAGGEGFDA